MADQQFCLRWNNHQSTLISVFDSLLENGTLVDCTLAAEGQYLKAHKVVLSACSPYLETLLSQHYEKHPIVILKDVKFTELKSMMDYMYRGEVNISQDQLGTFLKAAESLQIKGLSDNGSDGDGRDVGSTSKGPPPGKAQPPASNRPAESQRPASPPSSIHRSRDGSISPSSRKRRRIRRNSQGDDANMGDSHLDSNSCDLPIQAQSTPIVPNIPATVTSSISATPIKATIVKPEQTELVNRIDTSNLNSLPPESGLLKEKIEPISEPLLEPKTEYLEDANNEDSVEDLTLDDDDEMDEMDISNMSNMSNMSRPGPSHGNDVSQMSNQAFVPWQMGGNQTGTDEVFMAAQEAVQAHRGDSQDICTMDNGEIQNLLHNYIDGFECPSDSDLSNSGSEDENDDEDTLTLAEKQDFAQFVLDYNEGICYEGEEDEENSTDVCNKINDSCEEVNPNSDCCTDKDNEYIPVAGLSTPLHTLLPGKTYIVDLPYDHSNATESETNSPLTSNEHPLFLGKDIVKIDGEFPVDFLNKLFPDTLLDMIVEETVRYAIQNKKMNFRLTKEELKTFLGINIMMTYIKYPRTRMYWSSVSGLRIDFIAYNMSVNRFEEIRRFLHFVNNEEKDRLKQDKFWKLRTLIDTLHITFLEAKDPGVDLVDGMVAHYSHGFKYKKWYLRIAFYLINVAIVNAWHLYKIKTQQPKYPLIAFKASVAASYITAGTMSKKRGMPTSGGGRGTTPKMKQRVAASKIPLEFRYDGQDHYPKKVDTKQAPRCHEKSCRSRTRYTCGKCLEPVCPQCMERFHTK